MIISWGGTLVCVTFEVAKNCKFASECFSKADWYQKESGEVVGELSSSAKGPSAEEAQNGAGI